MPHAALRFVALLAAVLVLPACGTVASPSSSHQASASAQPAAKALDVLAVVCAPDPRPFDPTDIDLTGAWAGDDGGVYYFRQLGSVVWWNGMSGRDGAPMDLGRDWNNVGRGVINGVQIDVEWSDVSRGVDPNQGTLVLNIEDDGTGSVQLVTVQRTGGFGNDLWTPCAPVELQLADFVQTYGGDKWHFSDILTANDCERLAKLKTKLTTPLDTADAGSPEFRAALGYSNAIRERELALDC